MTWLTLDDQTYLVESDLALPGAKLPLRTTIIRAPDQSLFLHSPVAFSQQEAAAIDSLGTVKVIIAPSGFHYKFAQDAKARWPSADLWASLPVRDKAPTLQVTHWFSRTAWPHDGELLAFHLEGAPKIAETVFYAHKTQTLIVTDLVFNLQNPRGAAAGIIFRLFGTYKRFNSSRLYRHFVTDRAAFAQSLEPVLKLPFRRLIMAHGEVLTGEGLPEQLRAVTRQLCS